MLVGITLSHFHSNRGIEITLSGLIDSGIFLTVIGVYETNGNRGEKMPITQQMLDNWFTYHSPTADDQVGYVAIRDAAKSLAEIIVKHTPSSADQTFAIRLLREAVMTANASIACKGQ